LHCCSLGYFNRLPYAHIAGSGGPQYKFYGFIFGRRQRRVYTQRDDTIYYRKYLAATDFIYATCIGSFDGKYYVLWRNSGVLRIVELHTYGLVKNFRIDAEFEIFRRLGTPCQHNTATQGE